MTAERPETITVEVDRALANDASVYRVGARPQRELRVTLHWRKRGAWGVVILAVLWNVFVVLMLGAFWTARQPLAVLCLMPFAFVGAWLAYWSAAEFVNRTTFRLDGTSLSIRHAPLPWSGLVIARGNLRGVVVRERPDGDGGTEHLLCADVDGKLVQISEVASPEEAHYLAQLLTRHLDGTDDPTANDPA